MDVHLCKFIEDESRYFNVFLNIFVLISVVILLQTMYMSVHSFKHLFMFDNVVSSKKTYQNTRFHKKKLFFQFSLKARMLVLHEMTILIFFIYSKVLSRHTENSIIN